MILEKIGIYGWKQQDENLLLASLLTGDPLLLIGPHGTAKTATAMKIAEALGKKFIVYDASKCLFEDVLGYPDVEKLKQGEVSYIPSKVTVWDKEFVLIDELNRALSEMQNKWLEIIRSRKVMGYPTELKWVWAAMNPISYAGTQTLDDALVGRFALFLYPPEVLSMEEQDRIRVAEHLNSDDAPSLKQWIQDNGNSSLSETLSGEIKKDLIRMMKRAAKVFLELRQEMTSLGIFLARFADLLDRETEGEVKLDGRRLGFIYRNILSVRAVELARCQLFREAIHPFAESARYAVLSSIPAGINDEGINREQTAHKLELVFDILKQFFEGSSDLTRVDTIYRLFTTSDPVEKARILLQENLGELVHSKAWTDMINDGQDITALAYIALQVEAIKPGTIPSELIDGLGSKISIQKLSSSSVPALEGESIEFIDELEELLKREDDLEKIVAISRINEIARDKNLTKEKVAAVKLKIEQDMRVLRELLEKRG